MTKRAMSQVQLATFSSLRPGMGPKTWVGQKLFLGLSSSMGWSSLLMQTPQINPTQFEQLICTYNTSASVFTPLLYGAPCSGPALQDEPLGGCRSGAGRRLTGAPPAYLRVLSGFLFLLEHTRMRGFACAVSSKPSRVYSSFSDGGCAVVSLSSEACWDDSVSHQQRYQEGVQEESRKSKNMPCVLENIDQPPPLFRRPRGLVNLNQLRSITFLA